MENDITFALVVRLQKCETPFLNEYLEYYTKLGINKFYLINTEPSNRQFIEKTIASEFINIVNLIDMNQKKIKGSQNLALPKVNETFLLSLDMDEFLYLDGKTLKEFAKTEKLEEYKDSFLECTFHWVMSPLWNKLHMPSIKSILEEAYFFPSRQAKTMYYTKDIVKIKEHTAALKSDVKTEKAYHINKNNTYIFHVSSRGFMDIINKIQFGQFKDLKESKKPQKEIEELMFNENSTFLPNRFILLAFQSRFSNYLINPKFHYPEQKYKTDIKLLEQITLDGLNKLKNEKNNPSSKDLEVIEKLILKKMNHCKFHPKLIEAYAKEKINLMDVLTFIDPKENQNINAKKFFKTKRYLLWIYYKFPLFSSLLKPIVDEVRLNNYLKR